MKITSAGLTVAGKIRSKNEDNFYLNGTYKKDSEKDSFAVEDSRGLQKQTFAVCDGMGGYESGEKASLKALETLKVYDTNGIHEQMKEYVREANHVICNEVLQDNTLKAGTTLTMMAVVGDHAYFCNVGDSRSYILREGEFRQISIDHTRAQSMINAGILDKEEARNRKESHILTQHLGIRENDFIISPQITKGIRIHNGDVFILCSDGLTSMLEDEEIRNIIEEHRPSEPKVIAVNLVVSALNAGGKDNITVIVVKAE